MIVKKIIKPAFFIATTFSLLYFIFQKIDYRNLKEVFSNADLSYLAMALLIVFLIPIFAAKKWQAVLKAIDYHINFKESFKIIMASFPLSVIAPSKSGDLIRAYYLKDTLPPIRTASAVMAERLIDVSVLAIYSFIGALFLKNELILGISSAIIFLIPVFFFVINKIKLPGLKWQARINNLLSVSKILAEHPKKLPLILFYSLLLWLIPIFEVKFLFLALGASVPWLYITAAFPITIFVGLIPLTIAGMGTRDSAIIYFFNLWAKSSICLGVGLLYSLFTYWLLALLGLPFMRKLLK